MMVRLAFAPYVFDISGNARLLPRESFNSPAMRTLIIPLAALSLPIPPASVPLLGVSLLTTTYYSGITSATCNCVLVDILLLRIVNAHERLDRLDHALRVTH